MNWLEHHKESELYASDADVFARRGDYTDATQLYERAARAEEQALNEVGPDKPQTYGITAVGVVALYLKADDLSAAKTLAHRCLGLGNLPEFAEVQIEEMLDSIRIRQTRIDDDAHLLVSARGGEIVTGGAPWDLIKPKMEKMVAMLYRTTEYMKDYPLRRRGGPRKYIRDAYQPWLFQAEPGSYQFKVSLQRPVVGQAEMFDIPPREVVGRLLEILSVCATAPSEGLPKVVHDDDYAGTFLKLVLDLTPTSTGRFDRLDIRGPSDSGMVSLRSDLRVHINEVLRDRRPPPPDTEEEEIHGVLRALHLDEDWIEIASSDDEEALRIDGAGDEVDDRIGPMVNQRVIVQAARAGDKREFISIETYE